MSYHFHDQGIALEQLGRTIDYNDATEAIGFITKTLDIFMRMINNFRTSIVGIRKSVKRSELKTYHDSHILAINKLFKSRYFDSSLSVPIPYGMKVPYLQATEIVNDLYKKLDIESTIKVLSEYFSSITGENRFSTADRVTTSISHITHEDLEQILRQVFTNDKTLEVKLGEVFASFDEILLVDKYILYYDIVFQKVERLCNELDRIERIVDVVVSNLEKQTVVDKTEVQSLYQLVRTAGVQLDAFGVILDSMQRIEHNFVICLRRLVGS